MRFVVEETIQELRSPNATIRQDAAQLLGKRRPPEALQPLLEALYDNANEVLLTVIEAVTKYGEDAVEGLVAYMQSPDSSVRYAAALALLDINSIAAESALIDALNDSDKMVAEIAAEALERLNTPNARAALQSWQS